MFFCTTSMTSCSSGRAYITLTWPAGQTESVNMRWSHDTDVTRSFANPRLYGRYDRCLTVSPDHCRCSLASRERRRLWLGASVGWWRSTGDAASFPLARRRDSDPSSVLARSLDDIELHGIYGRTGFNKQGRDSITYYLNSSDDDIIPSHMFCAPAAVLSNI